MCFFKYTLICHREGGRESDRGDPVNYNKVVRMRVHIITGLPRFARNDKEVGDVDCHGWACALPRNDKGWGAMTRGWKVQGYIIRSRECACI